MRVSSVVAGLILIAGGMFLILHPPRYSSEQSVFKLGDLEAKVQQERALPGWVGGIALGAGIVLLGAGLTKRS